MDIHHWMLIGYVLFVTLNAADLWITRAILNHPKGREKNPIMRFVYRHMGLMGMAAVKVLILSWFGIQYYFKVLDLYTIFYLDLVFSVVLYYMYQDAKESGLSAEINPVLVIKKYLHR